MALKLILTGSGREETGFQPACYVWPPRQFCLSPGYIAATITPTRNHNYSVSHKSGTFC